MTNYKPLEACGRALYGRQWHRALAADLGVSDRTIRRWQAGTIEPDPALKGCLIILLQKRRGRFTKLIEGLKGENKSWLDF